MGPNPEEVTGAADSIGERTERVTAQDVESAKAKEKEASTALLDAMEASVEQQGQWFVPVGEKRPITETKDVEQRKGFLGRHSETVQVEETVGHEDTRAFIMKAPYKHDAGRGDFDWPRTDFVVVTPRGIFSAQFTDKDFESNDPNVAHYRGRQREEYELLKGLTDGTLKLEPENSQYIPQVPAINGNPGLRLVGVDFQGKGHTSYYNYIGLGRPENDFSDEKLKGIIEESISQTESPHKANFERAQADAQLAQDAVSAISALPPRQ